MCPKCCDNAVSASPKTVQNKIHSRLSSPREKCAKLAEITVTTEPLAQTVFPAQCNSSTAKSQPIVQTVPQRLSTAKTHSTVQNGPQGLGTAKCQPVVQTVPHGLSTENGPQGLSTIKSPSRVNIQVSGTVKSPGRARLSTKSRGDRETVKPQSEGHILTGSKPLPVCDTLAKPRPREPVLVNNTNSGNKQKQSQKTPADCASSRLIHVSQTTKNKVTSSENHEAGKLMEIGQLSKTSSHDSGVHKPVTSQARGHIATYKTPSHDSGVHKTMTSQLKSKLPQVSAASASTAKPTPSTGSKLVRPIPIKPVANQTPLTSHTKTANNLKRRIPEQLGEMDIKRLRPDTSSLGTRELLNLIDVI